MMDKDKKIGVITFWDSHENYGQLLQCFALQYYLCKKGYAPELIKYLPAKTKKSILDSICKLANPLYIWKYWNYKKRLRLEVNFNKTHLRFFDEFRARHITATDKTYIGYQSLCNEVWKYETLICGSDQIWRYDGLEDNVKGYFLHFAPKAIRKIAYAASFGRTSLPADYAALLPSLIADYTALGLRENSGVVLCMEAGRDDSTLVADPTLLLVGEEYIKAILEGGGIKYRKSCFCYFLNWDTLIPIREIGDYTDSKRLSIEFFPTHGSQNQYPFKINSDLTIPAWIESLASSDVVFTNSFHGTVFAILFKRNFIVFPLTGKSAGMNDRVVSLLSLLGIDNRIYCEAMDIESTLENPIDWDQVDKQLKIYREKSSNFLLNALME